VLLLTGCIPSVDEAGLLDSEKGVDLVLMEEDKIKYDVWHQELMKRGYKCIWYAKDTYDETANWSLNMRHSAWIHKRVLNDKNGTRSFMTCKDYVKKKGYTKDQINCIGYPTYKK